MSFIDLPPPGRTARRIRSVARDGASALEEDPVSLFWRVCLLNATLFLVAGAVLALSPATVSFPVSPAEAVTLGVGIVALIVLNVAILRPAFAPLRRLADLMSRVDLLTPGERIPDQGSGEVARLVTAFNAMLDRLEHERRESSRRALVVQEQERRRVAQELHDEVGQSLTGLLLQISRAAEVAPEQLRAQLVAAREAARASLEDVREVARKLRPEALDDLGLQSALTALCTTFAEGTGVPVERHLAHELPPLAPEQELVLYRVAQEGLTNVARHAGASRVTMDLEAFADRVVLRIADDGRGLRRSQEGAGMRGMRERAMLVGGRLTLEEPAEGGVQVGLEIPLDGGVIAP